MTRMIQVIWILLLLFILNFYTATSKHKVLGSGKPELSRE